MTIHFALAQPSFRRRFVTSHGAGIALISTNDNPPARLSDTVLRAALEHFSREGLNAVKSALNAAETALNAGNGEQADHWLAICRALDSRAAAMLIRRLGGRSAQI